MQIQFIKNVQFSRVLKADGRMREFNFRKPNGRDQAPCTVDVSDDRGHRIVFSMHKGENHWKIVSPALPTWITQLENKFDELIEDEISQI